MAFLRSIYRHLDSDLLHSLRWQYFLNIGLGLLGAGFIFTLGRLLGAERFGIYTLCAAIPAVAVALLDLRLQEFVLYLRENSEDETFGNSVSSLFWLDAVSKALVGVISILVYFILEGQGYKGIVLEYVAVAAAMIFFTKSFSSPAMGVLRSSGKLEYFSIAQVVDWSLRLSGLFCLMLLNTVTIPHVFFVQILVGMPVNFVVARRALSEISVTLPQLLFGFRGLLGVVDRHARLLFSNQGISATDAVVKELDVLVSGIFLSTAQIGTYKVAKSMAAVAWRMADPILIVIMPKLARMHAQDSGQELAIFLRALTFALTPSAMIIYGGSVAAAMILGPQVVGPEYSEAIRVFPIASAWILIALPLVWTHSLAIASGRPSLFLLGSSIGNGLGLVAIYFGAWQFGIEGALTGLSLAFCLPFAVSYVLFRGPLKITA